jgi:hypothetical protein
MPVEARPLFRPDVVARRTRGFVLPERVRAVEGQLRNWATLIEGAALASYREQDLLPDFLSDLFVGLLGYIGPASGAERYTLSREKHVEVEGEFADAMLGEFGAVERPVAAVEGKGPRDPLDRPFGGRRLSAVEQGYRYATNLPCDWIVVTNIREIRLYHKGSDQRTYERFALKSLREEYARTVEPMRETVARALRLERRLAGLVDEAYGLTAEEVALVWRTAPPRMPIPNPVQD